MSDELAQARSAARWHEADCAALERAIGELGIPPVVVPGLVRESASGIVFETYGVDRRRYEDDDLGRASFMRDVHAGRAAYLRTRWEELNGRAERRERARERAAEGVGRFVGGRFDLRRMTAATAACPPALAELRAQRNRRAELDRQADLERIADTLESRGTP